MKIEMSKIGRNMIQRLPTFIYLLAGIMIISSCASSGGLERAERTKASMEGLEETSNQLEERLNATEKSLNNLTQANASQLEEAYNNFRDNVSEVVDMQERFNNEAEQMETRSQEYLSEWKQEGQTYSNAELREASQERRRELSNIYDEIISNSSEVSNTLDEYVTDVQEIETYLSNDLTMQGLSSIEPLAEDVNDNGQSLERNLSSIQNSISTAREEMGAKGTQGESSD